MKRETYPDMAACEAAIQAARTRGSWEQAAADLGKYKDHKITFTCESTETLSFTVN